MTDQDKNTEPHWTKQFSGWARRAERREGRREKIRDEIERNRRGDYKVPTWVLAAILLGLVGAWILMIILV
jgi:hypothetical protein